MATKIAAGPITHGTAQRSKFQLYRNFGKRFFDICFTLAILPFVLPVILILALWISRDGGKAFFAHRRVGRNGIEFGCLKLRTMVPDAEEKLRVYLEENPEARAEWERSFKLENDPRITRLGHFLRATSLDELPQFFNVLAGQLAVIGPRPVTGKEIKKYGARASKVLSVRPGVSGPWQVSGRNDVSYEHRIAIDTAYVDNLTWATDVKVIFKTILVMFKCSGR